MAGSSGAKTPEIAEKILETIPSSEEVLVETSAPEPLTSGSNFS